MKKGIKNNFVLQKILSITLVLIWMTTVFIFSSQDGTQSMNTSGAFINAIDSKIHSESNSQVIDNNDNMTDKEDTQGKNEYKYNYSVKVQKIVRKNAHYFLYTTGGVILSVFFCVNQKNKYTKQEEKDNGQTKLCKKCIFYAIVVGIIYAITDELHQLFVPGRACCITDIFLDSLGIIFGVTLFQICKFILFKRNKVRE